MFTRLATHAPGMTCVRSAVDERRRGDVPERCTHPPARDHRGERHVAGADPLRARHEIRREPVSLAAEPAPEPPEAGDHLVGDEQDVALAADLGDRRPVALGRRDDATCADDRLADERCRAAVELVEHAREIGRVVVGDLGDVADEGSVAVAYRGDAGQRRAVRVRAVVREPAREDDRALRLPDERPVAARDLRGSVDRLPAARAEEDRGVVDRGEVGEACGEIESRPVRVVAEDVVRSECAQLLGDGVCDLGPAVTDVDEPEPGRRVEVLVSVLVPDAAALAAREDELVPVHLAHRGERVPEASRGGRGRGHRAQASSACWVSVGA